MSLVFPHRLMQEAFSNRTAMPGFNIDSWDMLQGVVQGIDAAGLPGFVQITSQTLDLWGWSLLTEGARRTIEDVRAPIALHLDHAKDLQTIERALDLGFTSVMIDGSSLPYKDNVALTRRVVDLAARYGAYVEGEIGHVGRDGEQGVAEHVTTVHDAVRFLGDTGIDAMAIAIGTRHGHRRETTELHHGRLQAIREAVSRPLVLHGASSLDDDTLKVLVREGITKINLGTEIRRRWWRSILEAQQMKPREALSKAREAAAQYASDLLRELAQTF